jgi:hypothetical protein
VRAVLLEFTSLEAADSSRRASSGPHQRGPDALELATRSPLPDEL